MRPSGSVRARNASNWRSVRIRESEVERELRQRHVLWLHGLWIGLAVTLSMWGLSHLQMMWGNDWLAGRYLITLAGGYLAYLGILRLWAGVLLREEESVDAAIEIAADAADVGLDVVEIAARAASSAGRAAPRLAAGGGDFAGGGASAGFDAAAGAGEVLGEGAKAAGGALEALGSADEGAVVVIPVVAVFLIGAAVFFGAGSLMLLFFGTDVLLGVAVELAFGYASGRVALRVAREGWLSAAVRLTWKPFAGAMVCAAILGAAIDHFIPHANSLPQAVKAIRAQGPK